jgi:LemA protein
MNLFAILLIASVVLVGYVIAVYNSLQVLKTRIVASIQEIGNQLKRQASLIPNLTESAKGYLKHEKEIFQMLTDARKAVEVASEKGGSAIDTAVDKLNAVLPKLNVLVESNPELKADTVVSKLMDELRDTSDKLMYSRRTLIDLSADYNAKLVTFPSNLVANAFGFKPEKGLDTPMSGAHTSVSEAETQDVKVNL